MMAPSVDHGLGMLHQRNLEATPANNFDTTSVIVTNSEDVTLSSGAESNGKEHRYKLDLITEIQIMNYSVLSGAWEQLSVLLLLF